MLVLVIIVTVAALGNQNSDENDESANTKTGKLITKLHIFLNFLLNFVS